MYSNGKTHVLPLPAAPPTVLQVRDPAGAEKFISKANYLAWMHRILLDDPEELELKEGLEFDAGLETEKAGPELEADEELDDDVPKLIWPETEE